MEETLHISYFNCGFCAAKNHCAACGAELAAALVRRPGVQAARVNLLEGALQVVHTLEREELEDLLDGMGILAE